MSIQMTFIILDQVQMKLGCANEYLCRNHRVLGEWLKTADQGQNKTQYEKLLVATPTDQSMSGHCGGGGLR